MQGSSAERRTPPKAERTLVGTALLRNHPLLNSLNPAKPCHIFGKLSQAVAFLIEFPTLGLYAEPSLSPVCCCFGVVMVENSLQMCETSETS